MRADWAVGNDGLPTTDPGCRPTGNRALLEIAGLAKDLPYKIEWSSFTSGPPLLEAMSIGSVDLGSVGDTPPIFAQAANANVLYVAGSRITNGQGILVPANSGIRSIADLKGKRVGFTKGSSAHNVVIATLEKAGHTVFIAAQEGEFMGGGVGDDGAAMTVMEMLRAGTRSTGDGPISQMKSARRSMALSANAEPSTTGNTEASATPLASVASSSSTPGTSPSR